MSILARLPAALVLLIGGVLTAISLTPPVEARTVVSVGIGAPAYGWYGPYGPAPYPYGPPAYYYAPPPPVYVAPPATYVVPAPAPVIQGPAPASLWYYCDDPAGYYPSVPNCNRAWRPVQPTPGQ